MNVVAQMYRGAAMFVRRCPWLFLAIVAVELAQHLIEYRAGFYADIAAMKAAEHDAARLAMGHVKVLTLFAAQYWALRFFAFGNDAGAPLRRDPRALALFLPVMAWGAFWLLLTIDLPLLAPAPGIGRKALAGFLLTAMLVSTVLEVGLSAWKTTAASGDGSVGFIRSLRLTQGHWWWGLGISVAAILPAMALHYALAFAALDHGPVATAAVLTADSLLVGYMGPLMAAATFVIARRVRSRKGIAAGH